MTLSGGSAQQGDQVTARLVALGERHEGIRAMVLFSSRANPSAVLDVFSDYDVMVYADDPAPFGASDQWFESLGPVMAVFREEPSPAQHYPHYTRLVLYHDGTKIDFGIGDLGEIRECSRTGTLPRHYDHGYRAILDKDGIAAALPPPTFTEFIPSPPTEAEFAFAVREFWFDTTYVAKYLWRDDLMAAKYMLDYWLKSNDLRRMLEWSIEIDRGWTWKPGQYGRGIRSALDTETYAELIASYAGAGEDEMWESLARTGALYRRVAMKVADACGHNYPQDVDESVTAYHRAVRALDRRTTSPDDLTRLLEEHHRG